MFEELVMATFRLPATSLTGFTVKLSFFCALPSMPTFRPSKLNVALPSASVPAVAFTFTLSGRRLTCQLLPSNSTR
ncbi:hypothetical protein D3C78_1744150 [compost metagenome]